MKKIMHISLLLIFLLGSLIYSPVVHAFSNTETHSYTSVDCEQEKLYDSQIQEHDVPNNDNSEEHFCGHCGHSCHHTHLYSNIYLKEHNLIIKKSNRLNLNHSMVVFHLNYELNHPPRTFV